VTDARYTYTAGMPAARVGWLVARARAVAGIADRDLASSLGVPLRTVRRWERGDLVPTDDEVEAIAAACGTRLTELLPRRASVSYDPATGIMRMGDQAVAMPGSMLDNDTVLGAYIGMVRRQRGLRADQDVKVRQEDLEALSEALDLDDDELEERLVRVIGISRTQAAAVRAQLLRRRLAVPMVGMLAGLSLLGVNRIFTTATEQVKTVAGGAVTRGNPYATTTTSSTVFGLPIVVTTSSTSPTTEPTSPPVSETLPAVVTAEPLLGPPQPERTGPPRSRPVETSQPETTEPPATDPVTTPAPTTPITAAPTTPPSTAPPATQPTVAPINDPGVQDTTTVPAPTTTTTTTDPNAPTTTTTVAPTTTTTGPLSSGGSTTGTTEAPPPVPPGSNPLAPVDNGV
jgi:transcriptional regulator with XRE-family HTH domain